MNELLVTRIQAEATSGARLNNCIKAALVIAVGEWRNVEFTHNGKTYRVDVNDLFECVKEIEDSKK